MIAAVAIIAGYAFMVVPYYFPKSAGAPISNQPVPVRILPSDQIRGRADASKTIIEFGDLECPSCGAIDPQIANLINSNPDIRLVWKDCPLPSHPNAIAAAEADLCAGEQGKYWEYHDLLIQNQDELGPDLYSTLAATLNLDTGAFAACLASGKMNAQVLSSLNECDAAGVTELPWFSVNGSVFTGADALPDLINKLNQQ